MEKEQLNYTLILHQIRKKLKLTLMEYCIADSIYHLSNNPQSKIKGWCYASKEHIAEFLGTTRATIFDNLNKLIKKGLIEKDEETKHLRTTQKWYDNVVIMRTKAEYKETLHTIKKLDGGLSRNLTTDSKETGRYNNKDNNKDNNKNKLISKTSFAGNEISLLIEKFKEVNPSYEQLFKNKSQRSATERLVKKYGVQQVEKMIDGLQKIFGQPYAPTITTPYLLELKLADYISYIKKEKLTNNKATIL